MNSVQSIMEATDMDEMQAYRHLQDRRRAQALYSVERRKPRYTVDSFQASEALRLWQLARAMAKRGERIAARAYYRDCLTVLRRG